MESWMIASSSPATHPAPIQLLLLLVVAVVDIILLLAPPLLVYDSTFAHKFRFMCLSVWLDVFVD